MKPNSYRPRFFSSLAQSCYSTDFYARIKDISLLRAIVFLGLFSILVAIFAIIIFSFFWSRLFPTSDSFLKDYDDVIPAFEIIYDDSTLITTPSTFQIFFTFDDNGQFHLSDKVNPKNLMRLQIDSGKELKDVGDDIPQALGLYLFKDGFYVAAGLQSRSFTFEEFEFDKSLSFDKESFRLFVKGSYPIVEQWTKRFLLITGPMMLFLYHFLGGWVLAFFFSFIGMLILYVMKKPLQYTFLLKLSFYSMVPAFAVALLTALLSISVSFIPILVYAVFYFHGLRVYRPNRHELA